MNNKTQFNSDEKDSSNSKTNLVYFMKSIFVTTGVLPWFLLVVIIIMSLSTDSFFDRKKYINSSTSIYIPYSCCHCPNDNIINSWS